MVEKLQLKAIWKYLKFKVYFYFYFLYLYNYILLKFCLLKFPKSNNPHLIRLLLMISIISFLLAIVLFIIVFKKYNNAYRNAILRNL